MRRRILVLAGAALLAAAPAFAGQSTRAEREATRQLNLEAAQQSQSNAAPIAATDAGAKLAMNSPPAAAPTARIESAAIASPATIANPEQPAILSSILRPPSKIASANVLDAGGQTIGAVQRVEVTPQGVPTKVAVVLIGRDEKLVVLDADKVTYDPSKNEIVAQQSGEQIKASAG